MRIYFKGVLLMLQRPDSALSDSDQQSIEAGQLGAPLGIYRIQTWCIRLIFWGGWFLLIMGMVVLITIIHDLLTGRTELMELSLLTGSSAFLGALLFWRVGVPQFQSERVVVCEHGILHVRRQIKKERAEVVRWEDILAVKKFPFEYYIQRREGEGVTLALYQNLDELIALIQQRLHTGLIMPE